MAITIGTAPDSRGVWIASDPRQPPWERFLDWDKSLPIARRTRAYLREIGLG